MNMKRMRLILTSLFTVIMSLPAFTASSIAQGGGGDQILDGIGETALIVRYVLNGNPNDWTRNNFHATVHGAGATFVQDTQFGSVLSLSGQNDSYVQLPGEALNGEDTLSVSGWVFLNAETPGQQLFDFGQSVSKYFSATLTGGATDGFRARVNNGGTAPEQGPTAARIATGQWVHVVAVLDAANRTLTTYVNGERAGQTPNIT